MCGNETIQMLQGVVAGNEHCDLWEPPRHTLLLGSPLGHHSTDPWMPWMLGLSEESLSVSQEQPSS